MKTIRRTRITVRKREVLVVKTGGDNSHFEETETQVCPLCHSPIHSKPPISAACDGNLLTTDIKNLLTEKK